MAKRIVTYHGDEISLTELSKLSGISVSLLRWRIKKGMTVEQAAEKPVRKAEVNYPCGAKVFYDCLECKYGTCISISYPPMPGEGISDYMITDYK